ncbi:MAG: hypothetical protein U1D30_13675 [Planctomycetota bacterium]
MPHGIQGGSICRRELLITWRYAMERGLAPANGSAFLVPNDGRESGSDQIALQLRAHRQRGKWGNGIAKGLNVTGLAGEEGKEMGSHANGENAPRVVDLELRRRFQEKDVRPYAKMMRVVVLQGELPTRIGVFPGPVA